MNSRFPPRDILQFSRTRHGMDAGRTEDSDSVDLRGLIRSVWRGKWLVAATTLGLAALTYLVVSQIPATYESTAKVMLDPRKAQIMTGEEVVQDLDLSEEVVNGEAAVLRSNVLIERVVGALGPEQIDGAGEIGITPEMAAALSATLQTPDARSAVEDQAMQGLVWLIRRDLSVFREGDSYVIGIRMAHQDPVMAAQIANGLAQAYIGAQIDDRRDTTTGATSWLEARVDELRDQLELAESAVAESRAQGLTSDGGTVDTVRQQLADLTAQLISARSDRVAAEARADQLATVMAEGGLRDVSDLVNSALIEQLGLERINLARQDAQWAERYPPEHPERQRIARALSGIEAELGTEVNRLVSQHRNDADIAGLREDSLREGIAELESRVVSITRNDQGLRQLEREAQAKRQTYEALLSRLAETRTQEQLQQPDAKLIERASIPGTPAAPRPKLMAALGGMTGAVIGLGLLLFLEMTSQTFRTGREVEAATNAPLLTSIPLQSWSDPLTATHALMTDPYSLYGERIRHLRTSVLMRDGRDISRSVMLLSSTPGEGKTTTVLALAQMSVLAGKSVIVVDADLRRSTMHAAFGWDMDEDFGDFIAGRCALDRAIYTDPEFGFDFLAARGPQPEAADKLSTGWLGDVVDELKRAYDVVLIDAPALLAVSDALVVAQVVDTRLFLVRWGETPRNAVGEALAAIDEMGLEISGAVLTMVDPEKSTDAQSKGYSYNA